MATKRGRYIITSVTMAGAAALTILAGFNSLRKSERKKRELQPEPEEPQPEPQPHPPPDRSMQDGSSTGSASNARPRRRLLPPQWVIFLVLSAVLSFIAFGYLPQETQNLSNELSPTIDISVNRPGVKLLAVLDGSEADIGALFVEIYADGVPGGFRWRMTSSNDLSADDFVPEQGRLANQVTGKVKGSHSALYFVLTDTSITPDLQASLNSSEYNPTVTRGVREDAADYSWVGSNLQVKLPTLEFYGSRTAKSSDGWYAPSGMVIALGPQEIQTAQTNIVSPAFSSPGMWEGTSRVFAPYWSGTDLAIQSQESRYLFIAGLLFGIAGSALIASFQDIALRYRSWRDKRERNRTKLNPAAT